MKIFVSIQTSLHQSPLLNTELSDMLLKDQKYLCVSWASFARGAVSSGRSTVLLHAAWHTLSWMCTCVKPSSLNSMTLSMLQQYTLSCFVHLCPVKSQPSHSQQGQIPCCDMVFFPSLSRTKVNTWVFDSPCLWMVIVFEGDGALKLQRRGQASLLHHYSLSTSNVVHFIANDPGSRPDKFLFNQECGVSRTYV